MEPKSDIPNTPENLETDKISLDGGVFKIEFLPTTTEGLEIQTDKSLMRHAPNTPLPEASRIRKERDKENIKFRIGPGFKPKVAVRNLRQEGNLITVDTLPVTFPTYRAINDSTESENALAISNLAGTAGILFTTETDGSHKIILQHRSPNNFTCGDTPGASAAGYLDGELNGAVLKPLTTTQVKNNLINEMAEEMGISSDDVEKIIISGIGSDKVKIHDEFLLFGQLKISLDQVRSMVEKRAKEKKPNDEFDFEGRYFIIDGTADAIFKLLTEVQCPVPPTHAAAFSAAGYQLVLEQKGLEAAREWLAKLEVAIKINYEDINRKVAEYWLKNPGLINVKPSNKPDRKTQGYDQSYLPQDQGLPEITSELKRIGLI